MFLARLQGPLQRASEKRCLLAREAPLKSKARQTRQFPARRAWLESRKSLGARACEWRRCSKANQGGVEAFRALELPQYVVDHRRQLAREQRRHSVSNLRILCSSVALEEVVIRKRLQPSGFSDR